MGFRVLGFKGLGFWGLGFEVLDFGFWVLGLHVTILNILFHVENKVWSLSRTGKRKLP